LEGIPSPPPPSPPSAPAPSAAPKPAQTAALPPQQPAGHARQPTGFDDVRKVMILGAGGQGKSNLIRLLLAQSYRAIVVDAHREYTTQAVEIASLDELADYLAQAKGRWRIAYHNDHLEDDHERLCQAVYTMRNVLLCDDETQMFCSPSRIGPWHHKVLQYGRHRHVGHISAARRPASEINHACTANSWELYAFSTSEPRDIEYLRAYASTAFAAKVQTLQPHVCLWQNLYDRTEAMQEFLPAKA
jgi:Helicase HerA, central domain